MYSLDHLPLTVRRLAGRPCLGAWPTAAARRAATGVEFELLDDRHAPRTPTGSRAVAIPLKTLDLAAHYVLLLRDGRLLLEYITPAGYSLNTAHKRGRELRGYFIHYTNGRREYVAAGSIRHIWRVEGWSHVPAEDDDQPTPPTGANWPYSDN